MDNTSLNHSDIFILTIGTYLSLFKCLVRLTTQRILCFSTQVQVGIGKFILGIHMVQNSATRQLCIML